MDLAAHHLRSDMFQASPSGEVTVIGVGPRSSRARQLCPSSSDVDFLRDLDGVNNLDTEVANGAFDLGVPEKQLNGS
jgi:hypothetical protein